LKEKAVLKTNHTTFQRQEEKMKKIPVVSAALSAVLLTAVMLTVLSGCTKKTVSGADAAGSQSESNRLNIYCWTYYVPLSVREKFEAEYNVTIIFDEYDSNESMYTKIQAGGGGYDLVFPSGDYVSIMINQGMLEKIDRSKLSNLGNIDPLVL
jgi:spermidine/putrescine transport system substrate-binding protein